VFLIQFLHKKTNIPKNRSNYTERQYIFSYWYRSRSTEILPTSGLFKDIWKTQEARDGHQLTHRTQPWQFNPNILPSPLNVLLSLFFTD